MARMEEMGCEYVEVTAHEGARPTHAVWQGKVYHVGGECVRNGEHYADFATATGYGTGDGLCGWNCRHNFYPFYPGISQRAYTDARLEELNRPEIEYRGKKYTRYEISQMQRAKERTVRKYKRRFLAESEAGLDASTSAAKLKAARAELNQFIRETGSQPDSARTSVQGFGHSAAGKAAWAAKRAAGGMARKLDFMGAPHHFTDSNKILSIKAYQVKGHDTIFTQTNTKDAQSTIALISENFNKIPQLQTVPEIVVAKDVPGIAAYDHADNRLYVNEKLSNAEYIRQQLGGGYFVAETAEDVLKHEMHHKDHWDYIRRCALTSGKSSDIVKQEIESELREYVLRQQTSDHGYVRRIISENAYDGFDCDASLNELVAEVLLQKDQNTVKDPLLLKYVEGCVL